MVVGLAHGNDPAVHDRERTAVDSFGDVNPICGFDQELRLINRWAVGGRSPGRRIISSRAMPFWMVLERGSSDRPQTRAAFIPHRPCGVDLLGRGRQADRCCDGPHPLFGGATASVRQSDASAVPGSVQVSAA